MQAGTLTWHLKKQKHKLISNVDWKDYTNNKKQQCYFTIKHVIAEKEQNSSHDS